MKTRAVIVVSVLLWFSNCLALADRTLDGAEILQIFKTLTSRPRKTWIPAGTIEATHEEYRAPKTTDPGEINRQISQEVQAYQSNPNKRELTPELQKMMLDAIPFNVRYRLSNEYTMNSTVVVRFDGDRFHWEINVSSRTDSVKPGKELEGNFKTREFNLDWNSRRIFSWDGENYTRHFLPGNQAIVDSTGRTPHVVNGPLTAGIIPWGYGYYSYQNLSAAKSSAVERYIDGQTQIHLTLTNLDGSETLLVMDPRKDYAAISHRRMKPLDKIISAHYDNYRLISGSWVPANILIEQYDAVTNRLLAYDLWNITKISGAVPALYSFYIDFEPDTLIEYHSYVTSKPLMYRYSHIADTDLLLGERLVLAASEGTQSQNCATAVLKYCASRLGKNITDQQIVQLVSKPDKATNLYAMKQFAQSLGFYCRAVKTDIQTLKSLSGCQVILHIPGRNHFVVLDRVDDRYVWVIDLANNRFYYHRDVNFFGMDWTDGTALLISNQPIQLSGNCTDIDDSELHNIIGGSGYSCTLLLQEYDVVFCSEAFGLCGGYYEEYYELWGCESAPSGSCSESEMISSEDSPCIEDLYDPYNCNVTGEWTSYYMDACG